MGEFLSELLKHETIVLYVKHCDVLYMMVLNKCFMTRGKLCYLFTIRLNITC